MQVGETVPEVLFPFEADDKSELRGGGRKNFRRILIALSMELFCMIMILVNFSIVVIQSSTFCYEWQ